MNIPAIAGTIRRRILLNFRVAPEIAAQTIPGNFRPKLFGGFAIAGICLIRLEEVRPKRLPKLIGISSENAAHRIAVEWKDAGKTCEGVFVRRRDTDSRIVALAGGRVFPGVHHLADFAVSDSNSSLSMRVTSEDSPEPLVEFEASETCALPEGTVFSSLEESSSFFESGCIGYSSRPDSCRLDGLRLEISGWKVTPLDVGSVRSAYYDDRSIFPAGSIEFDHALLMRDLPHEWRSQPGMAADDS